MSEATTSPRGQGRFGPRVDAFDERADHVLERLRGHPIADRAFTAASHLGDWSLVWHLCGAARALTGGDRWHQALVLSAALGAESLIVNQGVKRLFRRQRPTESGDARYPVRRPSTSSFPSGHASAAAFAATLLVGWDGPWSIPLWVGLAAIVGTSRAYVRIHHASDVIGGYATGLALGLAARAIVATAGLG
jgi:undecaprenyl-diphosphatase